MISSTVGNKRGLFSTNAPGRLSTATAPVGSSPTNEGKRILAAKVASSVSGGGGDPIRVVNAFIQVRDYQGLDRYLSKHKIPTDKLTSFLQKAAMTSESEAVEVFAKHGADVNYVDQFGTTLLHFAMRGGGNEQVIKSLVAHGLDYSTWRMDGMPLLHWACSVGFLELVKHMVEEARASLQEPDESGRLPIHVAAVSGQPEVLSYLIGALAKRLSPISVPPQFLEALEEAEQATFDETDREDAGSSNFGSRTLVSTPGLVVRARNVEGRQSSRKRTSVDETAANTAQTMAAANYLDMHQWTPLHHASCEEAINQYQDCLKMLLDNGADPMLPTLQGKTALDLAYAAGRSQILVDVLPKRQLIALLMRIDDIVPVAVRKRFLKMEVEKTRSGADSVVHGDPLTPIRKEASPTSFSRGFSERTRKGYSFIRRLADNMENMGDVGKPPSQWTAKKHKSDGTNVMSVWRKILLNDNVELLETLRDSMIWRYNRHEPAVTTDTDFSALSDNIFPHTHASLMTDFETAQRLSSKQMAELFSDCYENGTGVFSHVQANYQNILKANDFRTVLRAMTGLLTFNSLSTNKVVILRPMYKSLLFLALICGRFRVTEQLLRMRQFDVLPAAVLVTLILRRLRKEPTFPHQVISELERFTERIEAIAVDVLNLVSLKDNTPEKMICRDMLSVPLRTFGDLSLIDLFARAKCNDLLSLPCCQRVLDERWHGVLIHLPNWARWSSRFIPFTGVIYLDYKARKELASSASSNQVGGRSVKSYTASRRSSSLVADKSGTLTSLMSTPPCSIMPAAKKTCRFGQLNLFGSTQRSGTSWKRSSDDQSVQTMSFVQTPQSATTIYDRVVGRDGWHSSPRWYFVTGVYRSPSTKFCLHSLFHLLFLFFFSVVCVYSLHTRFTVPEIVALSYVAGYAVEELRQIVLEGLRDGLREYWKDGWNWIDLLAIGLTGVGFCIRMGATKRYTSKYLEAHDPVLYSTRNLYMFGLNLFYMRTLYITSISQIIGPRLKMMGDMLRKDLVPLLIVFAIFICSYGVWFQGLIYPNSFYETPMQRDNAKLRGYMQRREDQRLNLLQSFGELFRRAFYSIFEVSIVLEEESCEGNVYCGSETGFNTVIYFVLVLYIGIVNIILINLLIALFSNTVSRIDQKATSLWLAGRYKMVKEYSERTILPPPFNLLCVLYEVIHCIYYHCRAWIRKKYQMRKHHRPYVPSREEEETDSSDIELGKRSGEKLKKLRETKGFRVRLRNTRHLKKVMGSGSSTSSDKWELDAVLKFILLQSFALQDRRQTLGNGNSLSGPMSLIPVAPVQQESGDNSRNTEVPGMFTHVQQRLDQMEGLLNRVIDRLEDVAERKTYRTYASSPNRSPVRMRMPQLKLTRTISGDSETSIKIPTSKDIFEALAKESALPRKSNLLSVTSADERSSTLPTKKSRSLSFKE